MLKDPATRKLIAIVGLILGTIGSFGIFWAVFFGDAEWWSLLLLIPVFAVMRNLSHLVQSGR